MVTAGHALAIWNQSSAGLPEALLQYPVDYLKEAIAM